MPRKISLHVDVGERFGRLIVIKIGIKKTNKNGHNIQYCRVRCKCGNELDVIKKNLVHGNSSSCGCLHDEIVIARNYRHGEGHSRLYQVWIGMRNRCKNPNDKRYKNYGGHGILVCTEWDTSFATFREWAVTHGYDNTLTIERTNLHGNYTPDNCCFIPSAQQQLNTTRSVSFTCFDETKTVAEWARDHRCVVRQPTLGRRIRVGWSEYDALTLPANYHNRPQLSL